MSAKSLDPKGRFRGKIVSFRCSEEKNAALVVAVQLSGLTKQDYIISRVLNRDIIVQANPRVYNGVQSTRLVRCRTSATSPSNRLVMRNVRLYAKSGSIFLIILFCFALILADCKFIAKLKRRKRGFCSPQHPASIRAPFSQIATFSFFGF